MPIWKTPKAKTDAIFRNAPMVNDFMRVSPVNLADGRAILPKPLPGEQPMQVVEKLLRQAGRWVHLHYYEPSLSSRLVC
jgi:hypothetical protein